MFSKISSPLHEHELQEADPMIVYGSFAGHWKCDHCGAENNSSSHPFHCRQCSFDLCYSCVYGNITEDFLVHHHPLYYVETSRLYYQNQNGLWRCAVCKKTSHTLRETFSFHCPTCPDFDICQKCFVPWQHPIHRHVLRLVDTSLVYTVSGGSWVCDVCGHQSRPFEK